MKNLPDQNSVTPELQPAHEVPTSAILSPEKLTGMFATGYVGTYLSTLPIAVIFVMAFSSIENFTLVIEFLKVPIFTLMFLLLSIACILMNRTLRDRWIGIGSTIGILFWGLMFCLARAGDRSQNSGWFPDAYLELGVFFGFLCLGIPTLIALFAMIVNQIMRPSSKDVTNLNKETLKVIITGHWVIGITLGMTILALIIRVLLMMA